MSVLASKRDGCSSYHSLDRLQSVPIKPDLESPVRPPLPFHIISTFRQSCPSISNHLSSTSSMSHTTELLLEAFLSTTSNDIIPLTAKGVASGCKVFGAAILRKSDLSLVIAATNDETTSPLLVSDLRVTEWKGNGCWM
jgi:hypothetical protein